MTRHSESGEPVEVYGHVTAMSSSPDLTQSQSSDLSPRKLSATPVATAAGKYAETAPVDTKVAGADSAAATGISASRVGREVALGRRGSVELTKSEEDLFKEGVLR